MGLFGVDCHDGLLLALSRTFYREEAGIREICIAVFECLFFYIPCIKEYMWMGRCGRT